MNLPFKSPTWDASRGAMLDSKCRAARLLAILHNRTGQGINLMEGGTGPRDVDEGPLQPPLSSINASSGRGTRWKIVRRTVTDNHGIECAEHLSLQQRPMKTSFGSDAVDREPAGYLPAQRHSTRKSGCHTWHPDKLSPKNRYRHGSNPYRNYP